MFIIARWGPVIVGCTLGAGLLADVAPRLQAQPVSPSSEALPSVVLPFAHPTPPMDPGAPGGRQRGGAGRGPLVKTCLSSVHTSDSGATLEPCSAQRSLVALVPQQSLEGDRPLVWGLTHAKHPTFWFLISGESGTVGEAEFILQDPSDAIIHREQFQIPLFQAGVIGLPIPTTQPALQAGHRYHWTFSIRYDFSSAKRSMDYVRGTVSRRDVDPHLQEQLSAASPLEQVMLYAQAGFWHDALTGLAQLRRTHPQDVHLAQHWLSLLQQANLSDITTAPISNCCLPADVMTVDQSTQVLP